VTSSVTAPPKAWCAKSKTSRSPGSSANGFSEVDLGGDIGGPIVKKTSFGSLALSTRKRRKNFYLTQTFSIARRRTR
jgi:hypothetical protein